MKLNFLSYSVVLGAVTGLAFGIFLWGFEMLLLFRAHVAFAWLPGVIGMLSCSMICMVAALLTRICKNALLGVVFWVLAAVVIGQLLILIPIRFLPELMGILDPDIQTFIASYPANDSLRFWAGTASMWLAIFFAILGLLQNTLVEGAVPAMRPVGRLTPFLIMIPVIFIVSTMAGNIINEQLREPLIVTSELVQFAVDHQDETVSPEIARTVHLNALNQVKHLLYKPYRLFLGSYDQNFAQVNVLIDFDGQWANCLVIYAQPANCEPAGN